MSGPKAKRFTPLPFKDATVGREFWSAYSLAWLAAVRGSLR